MTGGRRRGNREGSIQWRAKQNRFCGQVMLDGTRHYVYGKTRREVIDGMERALKIHAMGLSVSAGKER